LVVIAIIAVLAAILFPVFSRAREKARATACLNNVRQITAAIAMYVQDHQQAFFPDAQTRAWSMALAPYNEPSIYDCPTTSVIGKSAAPDYGFNQNAYGKSIADAKKPAITILVADLVQKNPPANYAFTDPDAHLDGRHAKGANFGFVDGHVEYASFVVGEVEAATAAITARAWSLNIEGRGIFQVEKTETFFDKSASYMEDILTTPVLEPTGWEIAFYRKALDKSGANYEGPTVEADFPYTAPAQSGVTFTAFRTEQSGCQNNNADGSNRRWVRDAFGFPVCKSYFGGAIYAGTFGNNVWLDKYFTSPSYAVRLSAPGLYRVCIIGTYHWSNGPANLKASIAMVPKDKTPTKSGYKAEASFTLPDGGNYRDFVCMYTYADQDFDIYIKDAGVDHSYGKAGFSVFAVCMQRIDVIE
ncbi:MAG TPA: DUF1559 domain-containing protein, partial [Armatimonadota bacterium]|nr:DUF1559 domain-containing protein [Armatimonadota bacterium]